MIATVENIPRCLSCTKFLRHAANDEIKGMLLAKRFKIHFFSLPLFNYDYSPQIPCVDDKTKLGCNQHNTISIQCHGAKNVEMF